LKCVRDDTDEDGSLGLSGGITREGSLGEMGGVDDDDVGGTTTWRTTRRSRWGTTRDDDDDDAPDDDDDFAHDACAPMDDDCADVCLDDLPPKIPPRKPIYASREGRERRRGARTNGDDE